MPQRTPKSMQVTFENLTCIAGNCFDVVWVRQLTSIGTSLGIQYSMHGTDGLINNWTTMVSKYGRRNISPNIGNLKVTFLYFMTIAGGLEPMRWKASTVILPMANSHKSFPSLLSSRRSLRVQSCCTGQPPGTDCFYTGQSQGVPMVRNCKPKTSSTTCAQTGCPRPCRFD